MSVVVYSSICIVIVGVLFGVYQSRHEQQQQQHQPSPLDREVGRLFSEIRALARRAQSVVGSNHVALGYNTNLDVVARAVPVVSQLDDNSPHTVQDCDRISSRAEFVGCFLHFFKMGAAAERFVEPSLFRDIVQAARALSTTVLSPGGNAALMANRIGVLGGSPLLGGPIGPLLAPLLHRNVRALAVAEHDEYHLILEYAQGEACGGHTAPRANRFIVHSDEANAQVRALESFHTALAGFEPRVVVVAGLHLLGEQDSAFRQRRLEQVASAVGAVDTRAAVHLELASVADAAFLRQLAARTLPLIDSLGLNEQELADLVAALGGDAATVAGARVAEPAAVLAALETVFRAADALPPPRRTRLTRVHFHFLTHHVVAVRDQRWRNTLESAAAGSYAATTGACDFDRDERPFDSRLVELRHARNASAGVVQVEQRGSTTFFTVPVLVCRAPRKVVGLGDAVSSSAIATTRFVQ